MILSLSTIWTHHKLERDNKLLILLKQSHYLLQTVYQVVRVKDKEESKVVIEFTLIQLLLQPHQVQLLPSVLLVREIPLLARSLRKEMS
jgi:hypothetical protein